MDFLTRLNDYSCVEMNDTNADELYHYTKSIDAVKGILTGCFWATDIRDFAGNGEDTNEGYLILHQISEKIPEIDAANKGLVQKIIGTLEGEKSFFDKHETYVVSTCLNKDSEYMWNKYAEGDGYKIVFDTQKLINSLYFQVKNGNIRNEKNLFKHAEILYND